MANRNTGTNISASSIVAPNSRYIGGEVIYLGDRNAMTFATYLRRKYKPSQQDRFMVISPGMEYRPDLISSSAYGIPDLWWRIMEANNIFDVFDLKAGTNLTIPALF